MHPTNNQTSHQLKNNLQANQHGQLLESLNQASESPSAGEPSCSSETVNAFGTAYVKASDIAKILNVSSRHIHNLANKRTIPSIRIGKKCVRFDFEAVMSILLNDESQSSPGIQPLNYTETENAKKN